MPATRSSSTNSRNPRPPLSLPPSPRRKHKHDVISLGSSSSSSSSNLGVASPVLSAGSPSRRREKPKPTRSKPKEVVLHDVIEISSDEGSATRVPVPRAQRASLSDLRKEVRRLKAESSKDKKDYKKVLGDIEILREEIKRLQAQKPVDEGKIVLDNSEVEDIISCEICAHPMFLPYTLSDCGHTFCQTCLQNWLSTTLAHFINENPHYDVNQPLPFARQILDILQNPQAMSHSQIAGMIRHYLPKQPQYTCPTCREPVRTRPIENFVLRSLVRAISVAGKQPIPKTPTRGKGINNGPWDGFFSRGI